MSDFLTRLAERALGMTPLIEPRSIGLFPPLESRDEPTHDDVGMAAAAVRAGSAPTARAADRSTAAPEGAGARLLLPPDPAAARRDGFAVHGLSDGNPIHALDLQHPTPATGRAEQTLTERIHDARNDSAAPPAGADQARAPSGAGARPPAASAVAGTLHAAHQALARRASDVVHPSILAAASDARSAADGPVVEITIGRIDVRAPAAPAAEAPRVASRQSADRTLSLSDYLKGPRSTRGVR